MIKFKDENYNIKILMISLVVLAFFLPFPKICWIFARLCWFFAYFYLYKLEHGMGYFNLSQDYKSSYKTLSSDCVCFDFVLAYNQDCKAQFYIKSFPVSCAVVLVLSAYTFFADYVAVYFYISWKA